MATQISGSPVLPRVSSAVIAIMLLLSICASRVTAQDIKSQEGAEADRSSVTFQPWIDDGLTAIRMLHGLFPEVEGSSHSFIVNHEEWSLSSAGVHSFTLYVCKPGMSTEDEDARTGVLRAAIRCPDVTLQAFFSMSNFPLGRMPSRISIHRATVERRSATLETFFKNHPRASQEEWSRTLASAGAKYGPSARNQLVAALSESLRELRPYLGIIRSSSVTYSPADEANGVFIPPHWSVDARRGDEHNGKESQWDYSLSFNVFDGKLSSLWVLSRSKQ